MARADLLVDLIKYGLARDPLNFRKATEAICAEERLKQHTVVAQKIEKMLAESSVSKTSDNLSSRSFLRNEVNRNSLVYEKIPTRRFEHLILSDTVRNVCNALIMEQRRAELLQSYGLEPRNRVLLSGAPGNGKTSLAEAIAEALLLPLLTVRYERIIGSYLGETALRLSSLFEYIESRQCVLFLDEFETLGKERGDIHETGEIKRVVSSLLLQIDSLPSYVVVIAATNHATLLDSAVWRRFQIKLELQKPGLKELENFYDFFQKNKKFNFGISTKLLASKTLEMSFSEAEEFALSIYRTYILNLPDKNAMNITNKMLESLSVPTAPKS